MVDLDTADVCETAHEKTVLHCTQKNIPIDCEGCEDCEPTVAHYSLQAQDIFNVYYDEVEAELLT